MDYIEKILSDVNANFKNQLFSELLEHDNINNYDFYKVSKKKIIRSVEVIHKIVMSNFLLQGREDGEENVLQ